MMIKELVLNMMMALSAEAGVDFETKVMVINKNSPVIAQHAVGKKTGQNFLVINERNFKGLSKRDKRETLIHELAHALTHLEHGHTKHGFDNNKQHGKLFREQCYDLADRMDMSRKICKKAMD